MQLPDDVRLDGTMIRPKRRFAIIRALFMIAYYIAAVLAGVAFAAWLNIPN